MSSPQPSASLEEYQEASELVQNGGAEPMAY